ncbi:MAG TPA: XrtA system polysaccharide chain length determinant [Steroidobacteraceae bacterium]|nr:XrtA system polysaccharide chain length determinant [Steroidobacteraceae bacterium]
MKAPRMPVLPMHAIVQDLLDHLRGALHFRWVALGVAWCVALALWAGVFLIPDTYQASARVFVDVRTTLSEATKGIGLADDMGSQILRVRQALLAVPQLEKVAEETNLFAGALTPQARQMVIDGMLKDIDIAGDLAPNNPSAAVFTITYKNHDRAKSLQVVDRLVNTFVEGALGGKRQGSEQTLQFLQGQIADYGRRLSTAEQRLADFKKHNVGLMPKEQGDYFTRLQTETDQLTRSEEALNVAMRKRDELRQELRGGQPYIPGAPSAAGGRATGGSTDTETQIAQVQQQLRQLLLRYTDKHPDVIALRETLKELEARQKAEIAAARNGDATAAAQEGLAANPVYQKIEEQYNQAQVDIATTQQDIADRQKRIAKLRAMMGEAPQVEAQLAQLNRDYDVTRAQYNALLARLDSTRLGQEAQATGTVKFEVIDPPTAQFKPVAPNRPLLIVASLIAAIAAGLGAAYGLHSIRPVFVSTRQLGAITGLKVLGSVGIAWWFDRYHASRRRGDLLYAGGAVALVLVGTVVLALHTDISHLVHAVLA